MTLLYEGKAKKLYLTANPNELLMEFKDDATAFNGQKKAQFENKGLMNKKLSRLLYALLEEAGVESHFLRDVDETHMAVKRVEIVLIELVVRNVVAGSLAKRTGLPEGTPLSHPIVEHYFKNDELGDPMVTIDHIREMKLATEGELEEMRRQALIINDVLSRFFLKAGIRLVDFKLEFGRLYPDRKKIILADEISPDTCRFWDVETGERLDKDRFRRDLGNVMDGYAEVLKRVEHAVQC